MRDYDVFSELNDLLNFFNYKIVEIDHCSDSYHINIIDSNLCTDEEVFKAIRTEGASDDFKSHIKELCTEVLTVKMIQEKFSESLSKIVNNERNIDMMVTLLNRADVNIETDIYSHSTKTIYKMKTKKIKVFMIKLILDPLH